jgi:DNA-binding Lrp family transcriptional regulator
VDELDSAIIQHLQHSARLTNRDLARTLEIAPSTCLERVRSLRERGVITDHAEISLPAPNRQVQALLHVQIRPLSRQVIESFKQYVSTLPEVLSVLVVVRARSGQCGSTPGHARMRRRRAGWRVPGSPCGRRRCRHGR